MPDYFAPFDKTLQPYLPTFDYLLIDVSTLTDERLPSLKSDYARLTAILLQNSRRKRELTRMLNVFADVVRRLIQMPVGERFVGTGFLYLSYMKDLTKAELFGIFTSITTEVDPTVMSVAEELLEEGRQQATVKFIMAMLKLNLDAKTIASAAEMPLADVHVIIDQINRTGTA